VVYAIAVIKGVLPNTNAKDLGPRSIQVLQTSDDAEIRIAAMYNLWSVGKSQLASLQGIPLLKKVAKEDADPNVREAASELLEHFNER
jgi:hypothetical protein